MPKTTSMLFYFLSFYCLRFLPARASIFKLLMMTHSLSFFCLFLRDGGRLRLFISRPCEPVLAEYCWFAGCFVVNITALLILRLGQSCGFLLFLLRSFCSSLRNR